MLLSGVGRLMLVEAGAPDDPVAGDGAGVGVGVDAGVGTGRETSVIRLRPARVRQAYGRLIATFFEGGALGLLLALI